MNKKEYIQKAKQSILNKVKFHSPIVYDSQIDNRVLFENGVDVKLPVFKFDKLLNKNLIKAFNLAMQEQKFNLLISTSSLGKVKTKSLSNAIFFSAQNSSALFLEMINKLNINYQSSSNYNLDFKDKFVKINDNVLNPKFANFSLKQSQVFDNVFVDYREFVLNGTNFAIYLKNYNETNAKLNIELNLPLKKGYYYFKKLDKHIVIENLLTKESIFFNFVCRNAKFSFSNVDGLENSVFCCINVKISVNLKPKEERNLFFNLGQSRFSCSAKDIKSLEQLSIKKCCEIFNVQIKSKTHSFDRYFNNILPQKIWINWLNFSIDQNLEEKYLALKRLFVKGDEKITFVKFKEIGLKELGIFNGVYYKKILIVNSPESFIKVGNTKFFNLCNITNFSLTKKDPILLSFGE